MNTMEELRNQLAESFSLQKDTIIKDAISYALGRDDWELEEIINRCAVQKFTHNKEETFLFDNVPLITFLPMEFSNIGSKMSISTQYRKLYNE